jgi:hypothetical protein
LEGRDYFYTNDDVLEYLQQFGNVYDDIGVSNKFESLGRRARRSGGNVPQDAQQTKSSAPKVKAPSLKSIKQEEKLSVWRQRLLEDGFVFENATDVYVGKRIRRFFFIGPSDGEVICFRPETIDCGPMYGVLHDDKDTEVLDLIDIQRGYNDLMRGASREPFDYKLYDEEKEKTQVSDEALKELQDEHVQEIEEMESNFRKELKLSREKIEVGVSEYFEKKYSKLLDETREKYKKKLDFMEKKCDKYEKNLLEVKGQLQYVTELNDSLNLNIEKNKLMHLTEISKLKRENNE